jgi:hypothetical protein
MRRLHQCLNEVHCFIREHFIFGFVFFFNCSRFRSSSIAYYCHNSKYRFAQIESSSEFNSVRRNENQTTPHSAETIYLSIYPVTHNAVYPFSMLRWSEHALVIELLKASSNIVLTYYILHRHMSSRKQKGRQAVMKQVTKCRQVQHRQPQPQQQQQKRLLQ